MFGLRTFISLCILYKQRYKEKNWNTYLIAFSNHKLLQSSLDDCAIPLEKIMK